MSCKYAIKFVINKLACSITNLNMINYSMATEPTHFIGLIT